MAIHNFTNSKYINIYIHTQRRKQKDAAIMSYEDLVDEDLYTDLGDLSQQKDTQGSSQAQVEVNAGDNNLLAKEITEQTQLVEASVKLR